jgi:hypothetical protein
MSIGQQGNQQSVNEFCLADEHPGDLRAERQNPGGGFGDGFLIGDGGGRGN